MSESAFRPAALREVRRQRGLALRAFAARLGYSHSLVAQVESGQRRPSLRFLERVAAVYAVDLGYFFRRAA